MIQNVSAGIGGESEKCVVVLAPRFDTYQRVVSVLLHLHDGAAAEVIRTGIVVQNEWIIIWSTGVMSAVGMEIRRECERNPIGEAMRPMEAG